MQSCPVCERGDRTTGLSAYWRSLPPDRRAAAPRLAPPPLHDDRLTAPLALLVLGCALLVSEAWLGFVGVAGGGVWLVSLRDRVVQAARRRAAWRGTLYCTRCRHTFHP
ncbi:hypothetical protein AB0C59_25450 [Streptomyces sp. NPDC048664]|uniref:hypothetical protein n=1 Tax=Streptomyces sp. NPDC048664 TaxID=3154505 RepID=UPI00341450A9